MGATPRPPPPSAVAAAPSSLPAVGTPGGGPASGGGAVPPTAIPLGGTPAAGGTPSRATPGSPVAGAVNNADPRSVAQGYVERWNAKDYAGMYDLIGATEKAGITKERFVARYQGIAAEAGLASLKATLGNPGANNTFPMRVEMQSSLVGPVNEDNTLSLRQDPDGWRIAWTPSLIFKDLGDGLIRFLPDIPTRGRILDRKGRPLAQQGTVNQIGVIPQNIKDEPGLLNTLSGVLGIAPEKIKAAYAGAQPDWFVPIKIMADPLPADVEAKIKAQQGAAIRKVPQRVYPQGTLAAHVVGYIGEISAEELVTLSARGYIAGDRIGRAGIESWGEEFLAGKKGGQLTVVSQTEQVRKVIAERKSEPAADITLTIDIDLQAALEEGLGDRPSSGVVMDPATGGIVAMAAHPTYDPNGFILGFDDASWARLNDEKLRPLWNRATQFTYPSGSIYKVITATAAIEKLGMTPQTTIPCPAQYSLPGASNVWRDWTYPNAQGTLTLQNAITQSCNTVFFEIGRQLDDKDENALPEMTRAFGLGKVTGLDELPEAAGVVPDPKWKREVLNDGWATGDAINLSIGQGFFLASPLQMANLYNALANGGTLLRPFLAAKITLPDGKVVRQAERKEIGKLPTSPTALQMIWTAMKNVTTAPNGTAVPPFVGSPIIVAGKTGTAEVPPNPDHGWFASFAPADAPTITVLTMVENGGPGSKVAAPIGRIVYDKYATLGR
ncbi:MAG: penicillin-binding protein 2 [Thermomicrobiales bacterium]